MDRRTLAFAMFVFFALGCAPVRSPAGTAAFVYGMQSATVAIVEEKRVICTGVWIGPSEILTAAHCVDTFSRIVEFSTLADVGGVHSDRETVAKTRFAVVLARDPRKDLARLMAIAPLAPHAIASWSTAAVYPGMPIHVVGHTAGLVYSYSNGVIGAVRHDMAAPEDTRGDFYQVWAGAWGGNSGGGLWDDAGRLLGICSWRTGGAPLTFFITRETAVEFLTK